MNPFRGIPLNDVVYAIPVLVWLASFGLLRCLPRSFFQALCLSVPLAPTAPTFPQSDMFSPEGVAPVAAAMAAEGAGQSGFFGQGQSEEDIWLSATGVQRRRYAKALLRYPLRLLFYWKDVLTVSDDHSDGTAGRHGRALASLLTCFTALCVHANRASLISSIFSYLNALSVGKQCDFRYEAVGDMVGAVVGAMLANVFLLRTLKTLNADGMQAPSRAALVSNRPVLHWVKYVLFPTLRIALLLLSSDSLTFRVGHPSNNSNDDSDDQRADTTQAESAAGRSGQHHADTAVNADRQRGDDSSPETWARAAGAIEVTAPRLQPHQIPCRLPPMAYLCGGEGLAYAFSGFRFVYRGDVAQLRGAAWSYWMDSFQSYMSFWLRHGNAAAARVGGERGSSSGTSLSPTSPTVVCSPFTSVDSASGDIYFTSASSDELSQQNIVAFLSGCAVGAAALQGPRTLRLVRKVPVLSHVVNFVLPPPLPAIDIPEGLMDATLTDLGVVRLYYHHHHHHHRREDSGDSGVDGSANERTSLVWESRSDSSRNSSIVLETQPSPTTSHRAASGGFLGGAEGDGDHSNNANQHDRSDVPRETRGAAAVAAPTATASEEDRDYVDIPVPPQCFCPITRCLMSDPVRTVDGFTYDREAITAWLHRRATSPMTNLPLQDAKLVTNHEVYILVQNIVDAYNRFAAQHHRHHRNR